MNHIRLFSKPIVSADDSFATWSSVNKASQFSLSNQDRTFSSSHLTNDGIILTSTGYTSGKWYMEFLYEDFSTSANRIFMGLKRGTSNLEHPNYLGDDTDGWSQWAIDASSPNNRVSHNAANIAVLNASNVISNGSSYVSIAVDLDNGRLWWRRIAQFPSGDWMSVAGPPYTQGDPAAGTNTCYTFTPGGSTYYLAAGVCGNPVSTNTITLLKPSEFQFSPPTGYSAWV
jgi:hypothetical protein